VSIPVELPRAGLQGRFVFLDALRGLAAVAVVFFHFFNHWVSPIHDALAVALPRWVQVVLEHSDLGVEVFFVLSGFVIAHSLFGKRVTPGFAGNFILRRSLRLDPPYWVALGATLAIPYLLFPKYSANMFTDIGGGSGVLVNMFYLPDVLWKPRVVGVAWTLCLEVQFYLMLLILLLSIEMTSPRGVARLILWTAYAVLLGYSMERWFGAGKNDFLGRWWMFFSGVLLYWAAAGRISRRLFAAYLALVAILSVRLADAHGMAICGTVAMIGIAVACGGLQRWLGGAVVQYFGRISYSLYLVHMTVGVAAMHLVLRCGQGMIFTFVALGAAIVMSIAGAELLNRCVELPAVRLSQRLKNVSIPWAELGYRIRSSMAVWSLSRSMGLVRCLRNPASTLRATSSSMP
jgi:peptidoglycan/LPS O-acetylase OafA/YrhL